MAMLPMYDQNTQDAPAMPIGVHKVQLIAFREVAPRNPTAETKWDTGFVATFENEDQEVADLWLKFNTHDPGAKMNKWAGWQVQKIHEFAGLVAPKPGTAIDVKALLNAWVSHRCDLEMELGQNGSPAVKCIEKLGTLSAASGSGEIPF